MCVIEIDTKIKSFKKCIGTVFDGMIFKICKGALASYPLVLGDYLD